VNTSVSAAIGDTPVLDPNFDPLKALEQLRDNQNILFNNDQQLAQAVRDLQDQVRSQQEVIDVLIKGLDAANKANQALITQGLDRFLAPSYKQEP
jgi:hypothetical protein